MRKQLMAIGLAALVAGCSSGDAPGILLGDWGGTSGGTVAATRNGVLISLPCSATIRIAHAVIVTESGEFNVADSLRGSLGGGEKDTMPVPPPVSAVRVEGTLSGDRLQIAIDWPQVNDTTLVAGFGPVVIFDGERGKAAADVLCRA